MGQRSEYEKVNGSEARSLTRCLFRGRHDRPIATLRSRAVVDVGKTVHGGGSKRKYDLAQ